MRPDAQMYTVPHPDPTTLLATSCDMATGTYVLPFPRSPAIPGKTRKGDCDGSMGRPHDAPLTLG